MASSSSSRTSRRARGIVFRFLFVVFLLLGLAVGGRYAYRLWARPSIYRLDPALAEPGSVIRIEGRNFGADRGESRIEIDGVAPTASSYIAWSATRLTFRVPSSIDSGLVYVVTHNGRSNAKLFMNRSRLPVQVENGAGAGSGPFLASLSAEKGVVGSLLVISGRSFGASREDGAVVFPWNTGSQSGSSGPRDEPETVSNSTQDIGYELWSDKEIRVRVPDGASSGAVYVTTQAGKSNGIFFAVEGGPGSKRFLDRRSYAISYSVGISNIRASGSNELYLWVPRPMDYSSQRLARVLSQEPPPLVPDFRGVSLYRFKDLMNEQTSSASQSFLVQTYAVETSVLPEKIQKPQGPPPLMSSYTAADELVPSEAAEIVALAKKIVGGERNPWRAAKAVYDYLTKNFVWTEPGEAQKPLEALAEKKADSSAYAIIATALLRAAGVPALPVTGLLVDPSRRTAEHSWVEFYIYGLGWVPMDPVLGSGARPGGWEPAFEDLGHYFGNLDNRRIAFSRGYAVLAPMAPKGRRASPSRPLGYQSFYEEATGSLEAYTSFWSEVEVTGLY